MTYTVSSGTLSLYVLTHHGTWHATTSDVMKGQTHVNQPSNFFAPIENCLVFIDAGVLVVGHKPDFYDKLAWLSALRLLAGLSGQ